MRDAGLRARRAVPLLKPKPQAFPEGGVADAADNEQPADALRHGEGFTEEKSGFEAGEEGDAVVNDPGPDDPDALNGQIP